MPNTHRAFSAMKIAVLAIIQLQILVLHASKEDGFQKMELAFLLAHRGALMQEGCAQLTSM